MPAKLQVPIALILAMTAAAFADDFDKAKFMALKPGETKADVIASVGEPYDRWAADRIFVYRYLGQDIEPGKKLLVVITVMFDKDGKLAHVDAYSNQPHADQQTSP